MGIKAAWVLSGSPEQLVNVNAIGVEGHITGTSLLVHPLTEGRQQNGIVNWGLDRWQGDDPSISQVGHEQTCTMDHLQRLRVAVVGTVASTQVAGESCKGLLIQLTQRHAGPIGPIDEVFSRPKVSASSNRAVASLG